MSAHNGPRLNAIMSILKRHDLTEGDKEKQIISINKTFDKMYKKMNKK